MVKVFTTGTFDILHYGHINFLERAKAQGDYLIVGVNVKPDGKKPYYSYEQRCKMLQALKCVDKVVPLFHQEEKFAVLQYEHIDIFVAGEEYRNWYDIPDIENYATVVFLSRTPNISTTQLKEHLNNELEYHTIVIDVDDTILTTTNRDFENAVPHQEVIDKINELYDKGWKIIFATARGEKSCKTVEERIEKYDELTRSWLRKHAVKFTDLIFGKPNADFYVDDKNMSITDFLNFGG